MVFRRFGVCLALSTMVVLAGCSGDDTEDGGGGSSEDGAGGAGGGGSDATTVSAVGGSTTSSSDSTTSSTGTGGNACNDLQNTASEVTVEVSDAPPPEMVGGTIVDGVYHMTRFVRHPRSGMVPFTVYRATERFENGIETTIEQPGAEGEEYRFSNQILLEGNTMEREVICADLGPGPGFAYEVKYSATDTEIVLVFPDDLEITFTRQ